MARSRSFLQQIPPRFATSSALPTRDAQGEPLIRLQTLGAATILVGEMRLSAAADTLFALLLRIAYAPGLMLGRDQLVAALWPDQAQARQRANLRQSLYKLRSHGVRIAMVGDVVQLDARQLITTFALDRSFATFERDVTHGTEPFGVFLPGFTVRWLEYQEWVLQLREVVHADVRRVLVEQLRMRRERADWGGADALARWLLQFDPLNEEATLTVAECTALSGSKKEALAIIDRYLEELGPLAGDLRLPATMLRRRISDMGARTRALVSPTERYFVGREAEMAELTLAMRRAKWRDGSAVLLHGPSGIGKSRLVRELEKVAGIEGVRVLHTACRESDRQRPFSIFLDVAADLIKTPGALGASPESLSAIRKAQGEVFDTRFADDEPKHRVNATDSASSDSMTDGAAIEPAPLAAHVRRGFIDILLAIADEQPLMVVVDDVQWIDDSSFDLLSALTERLASAKLLLLLVGQHAGIRHDRPLRPTRFAQTIALDPLGAESAHSLAREIADSAAATLTDELAEWFTRASEGSPLFLTALVLHWIETGQAGGVPPSLRSTLDSRLASIGGDARRLLQAAVLLGRWATVDRSIRILELGTNSALIAIEELTAVGAFAASSDHRISVHDLMALHVTEAMPQASAAFLSRRIAEALKTEEASKRLGAEVDIVGHYVAAGSIDDAFRFALEVEATPRTQVSVYSKLAVFDRLFERVPSAKSESSLARAYRATLYASGQWTRLIQELSTDGVLGELTSSWDTLHAASVVQMLEVSQSGIFTGDFIELCNRGLLLARNDAVAKDLRYRACRAMVKVSAIGLPRSIPETAFELGSAIAVGLEGELLKSKSIAMYFHASYGDLRSANEAARAVYASIEFDDSTSALRERSDCGYAFILCGEMDRATEVITRVESAAVKANDVARIVISKYQSGLIALARDDIPSALLGAIEADTIAQRGADVYMRSVAARHLARLRLLSGDVTLAAGELERARMMAPDPLHPQWRSFTNAMHLGIAVAHGDLEQTASLLAVCESDYRELSRTIGQEFLVSRMVRAYALLGRQHEADELMQTYRTSDRREGYPIPRFVALR